VEGILEEYRKSGLTQRVFAQERGICVSTLQWWLRRAREGAQSKRRKSSGAASIQAAPLLEVELAGAAVRGFRSEARYEIELGEDVRLRLSGGFREEEVRRLLALLREVRA
jgi:transposase-like protein